MRLINVEDLIEEIKKAQESLRSDNDVMWELNKKYFKGLAWAHRLAKDAPTVNAVVLPCKVGDTVWCILRRGSGDRAVKGVVSEIYFTENMDMCVVVHRLTRGRWGERVFATEQEAQDALKKRRKTDAEMLEF